MKKQEIMEKLTELGVAFKPNIKKEELEAMLLSAEQAIPASEPTPTPEASVPEPTPEILPEVEPEPTEASAELPKAEEEQKEESNKTFTQFKILDKNFCLIRTYTITDHGENADVLARQFASKIGAMVKAE